MVNDLSVARVCEGTYFYSAQWTPLGVVFLFEEGTAVIREKAEIKNGGQSESFV